MRRRQSIRSTSATNSVAVTRSAVVPGFSVARLAQRGVEAPQRPAPGGRAHAAGGEHLARALRHPRRRVGAALARGQRVGGPVQQFAGAARRSRRAPRDRASSAATSAGIPVSNVSA